MKLASFGHLRNDMTARTIAVLINNMVVSQFGPRPFVEFWAVSAFDVSTICIKMFTKLDA